MESSFVLVGYPSTTQQPPQAEPLPQQEEKGSPASDDEKSGRDLGYRGKEACRPSAAAEGEAAAVAPAGIAGPSSSLSLERGEGEEKSNSSTSTSTGTGTGTGTSSSPSPAAPAAAAEPPAGAAASPSASPGLPMVRRIPVLPEWRTRLPLVMAPTKADGSNTPIGIIKDLSGAKSIEAAPASPEDGEEADANGQVIEIKAQEWQQLKEAEALLRLTFRDYDGVSVWWFYTIPTFVSCIISGTTGTEVPELSNPAVGLKCAIAPYDENSTRRAFFLTCPEWDPLMTAYQRIKKGWNYWRYQSLEKQIDRALGVLYGVSIAPIKADGNCLFRAFARAILGDEERHPETRAAIVAFMRASEELRLFIVSDDEAEDGAAYAERYLEEMGKAGTWGDQVEITAFTRVYGRSVRVFSYNYTENRLLSVGTPIEEGQAPRGPEVWLLHLHGHYSLLGPGVAPKDEGWERMLKEFEEEKGEQPAAGAGQGQGQGPEKRRPETPVVAGSSSAVPVASAAEQEESKQEEGGRGALRACTRMSSSASIVVSEEATTTMMMSVDGTSGVTVERSSSSSSISVVTTSAMVIAEGE